MISLYFVKHNPPLHNKKTVFPIGTIPIGIYFIMILKGNSEMSIKDKDIFDKIRRNNPYFEDFITRSVYHSNAIEGNTLSYAETYSIIFNDNSMTVTGTPREIYEAINLKYAMRYALESLDKPLTPSFIIEIGKRVNKNINEIDGFRKSQVFIRGAEHIPPDAAYVPQLIDKAIFDYYDTSDMDIFIRLASFHIDFERTHPFTDGNGRTGRMLITKELLNEGYAPAVVLKDMKAEYLEYLKNQDIKALSDFIKELSAKEEERMNEFGIKIDKKDIGQGDDALGDGDISDGFGGR